MNPTTIRVIAAVVTTEKLILYKEAGGTYEIEQGDHRLQKIVELATPLLLAGQVVEVSLDADKPNPYKEYEEQSGKVVRFFRLAKTKFNELFTKAEPEVKVQAVPGVPDIRADVQMIAPLPAPTPAAPPVVAQAVPDRAATIKAAAAEIVAHATPATAPGFSSLVPEGQKVATDTIVAVVGDQVVAGVEKIERQIARSVTLGTTKAMNTFLKRVASVASQRQHSADDLLKFLERADLPIAEDGCIVIYKSLNREFSDSKTYRDIHTGRVPQMIGDYVCMDPSLVDHDRTLECSNGLHVGRRDYMGSFGGNIMVLAKVKPEDVIAVPTYDANKMRVCGYHILFELSDEAARLVRSRKAFTESDEAKRLLGACLSGNHTGILRHVVITQQKGGGIQIQNMAKPALEAKPEAKVVKAEVLNVDETHGKAPALDPKQIAQTVAADKAKKVETRADKARALYNTFKAAKAKAAKLEAAQATLAFKKQSKVGWDRLGITSEEVERLLEATKV